MTRTLRHVLAISLTFVSSGSVFAQAPGDPDKSRPPDASKQQLRPGLSAQQSQEAIKISTAAMKELREKTEGAKETTADRREFVVGIERLRDKAQPSSDGSKKASAPAKAVVTYYRYFDDLTVTAVVDLETGKTTALDAAQHVRTPLSSEEYEFAKARAKEKSDEVKALFAKYGDRIDVYPQYSQYTPDGETRNHRVVHLTYRVGGRDLSVPRPMVDLTTLKVEVPKPKE